MSSDDVAEHFSFCIVFLLTIGCQWRALFLIFTVLSLIKESWSYDCYKYVCIWHTCIFYRMYFKTLNIFVFIEIVHILHKLNIENVKFSVFLAYSQNCITITRQFCNHPQKKVSSPRKPLIYFSFSLYLLTLRISINEFM